MVNRSALHVTGPWFDPRRSLLVLSYLILSLPIKYMIGIQRLSIALRGGVVDMNVDSQSKVSGSIPP